MKRRAFTLVEMLVVISIIVLLVVILVPSLSKALSTSRRAACLANLHGMSRTLNVYITDWNSLLPYYTASTIPNNGPNQWTLPLGENGAAQKVRQCPSGADGNPYLYTPGTFQQAWNHPAPSLAQSGGYTFNGWLYRSLKVPAPPPPPPPPPWTPPNPDEDTNPSDADDLGPPPPSAPPDTLSSGSNYTPMFNADPGLFYHLPLTHEASLVPTFADAVWSESFPLPSNPIPTDLNRGAGNSSSDQLGQISIARHEKSVNVVFYDGHAENKKLPDLWSLHWNAQWQSPIPLPIIH